MPTRYEKLTVKATEYTTEDFQLLPRERLVAVCLLGDWHKARTVGVDIKPHVDGEGYHPVVDGMDGIRAHVHVGDGDYAVINDFNHPLSEVMDDHVRLVLLDTDAKVFVPADEDHEIIVGIKTGE